MSDVPDDIRASAIEAAMAIAAEGGWRRASLRDIAARADVPFNALYAALPCKGSILAALVEDTDRAVLGRDFGFEAEDTPRDRLFEVLMSRFDALAPRRSALAGLGRDLPGDPLSGLAMAPALLRAMAGTLEAAGIPGSGPFGFLRAKGLAVVWLATMRVWLSDETPDHGRTMAALDRNLRRAERLAMLLDRLPGPMPRPAG